MKETNEEQLNNFFLGLFATIGRLQQETTELKKRVEEMENKVGIQVNGDDVE